MADDAQTAIPRLLDGLEQGDSSALDALIGLLYEELRRIAHQHRRRWRGDSTLGTTALLHEAYAKLRHQKRISMASRGHFLALASRAMRHILSTYAEQRRTQKRGGDIECVSLSTVEAPAAGPTAGLAEEILVAMDAALRRLETQHERPCRVVECRFYSGMTVEETAVALGMSPRTVKRDWAFAQAWLKRELEGML